ncbi:MAG: aminodeoxychorismate/anthranilate synthase component II [Proteobacteria bacterium]|nr:aminodeoxychorismate/anthranilate synthase component II [Pseudomonadota bacterium]
MNAHVLVIDNYDSFTYNLVQAIRQLRANVTVFRNDQLTVEEAARLDYSHLLISPGPGHPRDAGISIPLIRSIAGEKPLLGVCLGHQALVEAFGGCIEHAPRVMHGKSSMVYHDGKGLFANLPAPFSAGRYHSLCASKKKLPKEFELSAWTSSDEVMAVRHQDMNLHGVQFHPESVLTPDGQTLIENFLKLNKGRKNGQ